MNLRLLLALTMFLLNLPLTAYASAWGKDFWFHHPVVEQVLDDKKLLSGMVTALARDPMGHLYIGTQNGLVSFDGYDIRVFDPENSSIPGNYVRSLHWAHDSLWVGTQADGLARFDTQTGQFERIPSGSEANQVPLGSVFALAHFDDGDLLIATDGGVAIRDAQSGEVTRPGIEWPDSRCYSLWIDADQTAWVGTARGLLKGTRKRLQPASIPELGELAVRAIFRDQQGALWIGTREHGLARIDATTKELQWLKPRQMPEQNGLAHGWVSAINQPREDEIWVSTVGGGLSMLDRASMQVKFELRKDGLDQARVSVDMVSAVLVENDGNAWVGTWGGGLYRMNARQNAMRMIRERTPSRPGLSESQVHSVAERADGKLLVGLFSKGIDILDRQQGVIGGFRPSDRPGDLPNGIINALLEARDGSIWAGTQQSGVYRLGLGSNHWQRYSAEQGVIHPLIAALHETVKGEMWLGSAGGLFRFDVAANRFVAVLDQQGLPHQARVIAITSRDDGTVFAATDVGLTWVDANTGKFQQVTHQSTQMQGLTSDDINGVLVGTEQILWVDTDAGMFKQLNRASNGLELVNLKLPGRLFGGNLMQDRIGRLWSGSNVYDPASGALQTLKPQDGVGLATQWRGAYAKLKDGTMLFGGNEGLAVIRANQFQFANSQPRPTLSGLVIDGKPQYVGAQPDRIDISSQQRNFTLTFGTTEPSGQDHLRYHYRLLDLDTHWTEVDSTLRAASYGNLWPGDYRLQVQMTDRLNAVSPNLLEVQIQVAPRYWQTKIFLALMVLSTLLIVYAIHRLRTRAIHARAEELTRLVAVRTQELAQRSTELEARNAQLQLAQVELSKKHEELNIAARTDPLTGLRNRRSINEAIQEVLSAAGKIHAFVLIDIDHFKRINDNHGHALGDQVLIDAARKLARATREADRVFRWGGEEFLVIAEVRHPADAIEMANELQAKVSSVEPIPYTISLGWALWPLTSERIDRPDLDWTMALELADIALYEAKRAGRNRAVGLRICSSNLSVSDSIALVRQDFAAAIQSGLLEPCV